MVKLLAVTALVLLAVLAVQAIVAADETVVVTGATDNPRVINTAQGIKGPFAGGYIGGAYAVPVPVPPGVAGPYNLPCSTPNFGRTGGVSAQYLVRELGARWVERK